MTIYHGFIGTYTKGDSKGIYSFTLDTEKKSIENIALAAELGSPTYAVVSKDHSFLYAVEKDGSQGGLAAYRIEENKHLSLINRQITDNGSPCHLSVDSKGSYAVSANYHNGKIELYKLQQDGSLSESLDVDQHEGNGPHPERQEGPHAHYSGFTPDEKYFVTVDLGSDSIETYEIRDDKLVKLHTLAVKPGSGPRHIAFHPNGKLAYVMTELSNEVIALKYNSETGVFTEIKYYLAIPETFTQNSQGSAIHISADGRFVYAGNRGHNSIAVFSVDEETGELALVQLASSGGDWPRDFELDPTEAFIVGSNQESGNLVLYSRDSETGKLTLLGADYPVPYPVCVKFIEKA